MLKDLFYLVKEYFFPVEYDEYSEPVRMSKKDWLEGFWIVLFFVEFFFIVAILPF